MGPIDIKYHVVSIAAVFLALGIGILVGGSGNLIGGNTVMDRQNAIISGLEANQNETKQEIRQTRDFLKQTSEYVQTLETKTIPELLKGRLDGVTYGIVGIGNFSPEMNPADKTRDIFGGAGAKITWQVKLSEEKLAALTASDTQTALDALAKELLGAGAPEAPILGKAELVSGPYPSSVNSVVFSLGENLSPSSISEIVTPLIRALQALDASTIVLFAGASDDYDKELSSDSVDFVPNAETLPGCVHAVVELENNFSESEKRNK